MARPRVVKLAMMAGLAFAGAVAVARAATLTPIDDIVGLPEGYDGKQVTVVGTVTAPSVTVRDESIYTLLGQTRKLSVLSRGAAPTLGARLQVSGKIGRPDEEDAGLPFPPTLLESDRQPAP
jgi:hypothetical protein